MSDIEQQRLDILAVARKHFPFPTPNPGQMECIVEAVRAFMGGKKHVIIQAPTGIGKTAIATTVHRVMKEYFSDHRTTIITATKGLQDQYVEGDKLIYDLKGKTNYSCPYDRGPYNSGACRAHVGRGGCRKAIDCTYVKRRVIWCNKSELRLTNNSFQIEACPTICMKDENRANLIIADECHDLDDHIVEHTSIRFRSADYQRLARYGYGGFVNKMKAYINLFNGIPLGMPFKIDDQMYEGMSSLHDDVASIMEAFEGLFEDESREDHEELGDIIEQLQQIGDKTEIFDCSMEGEWVINEYEPGEMMVLKPVYAWQVSNYAVFRKADFFLHMSATICGVEEYAGGLGIAEYEYLDIPNPIPVENRKVFSLARHRVSGDVDYKALASDVDKLIDRHKGENGIIHTVSYALANEIFRNSNNQSRMLVSKERHEIVGELSKPKKGSVVLSASIEKGYDFKGDMSRFQIIAKVPYLYLGDPLVKLNAEKRPKWYARKAVLRIVQACGRSIRGVDDHAKTYILDSNFNRLLKQNIDLFPGWFLDSLVIA